MNQPIQDTIAALATPVGRGGIGVIRISGPLVSHIAQNLLGKLPKPRYAMLSQFADLQGNIIDQGIALYFPAPNSFTGEDVLELQGHGGIIVMDTLLKATLELGARLAKPGEFSERAFLNNKIDLVQAEAIADLIDSSSVQAARCALRSLQGDFSQQINQLVEALTQLRMYIEAGIDFVDEEIDLSADGQVLQQIQQLIQQITDITKKAQQGYLLKEGMHIVLVGEPNVGKSSLLNCLAGRDTAIVTALPGTTRDIIRDQIILEGMPLHITDTAGLRETDDPIEQEGIRRTRQALHDADIVILLLDDRHPDDRPHAQLLAELPMLPLIIRNKIDLTGHAAGIIEGNICYLSAKTGQGIDALRQYLTTLMGLQTHTEGNFMARQRHLIALQQAQTALLTSTEYVKHYQNELVAEELRLAQQALAEITGQVTADDLLGRIFSSFCIGK